MRTAIPAAPCSAERMRIFRSVFNVRPAFVPAWAPGDAVMWDNRCVLHRADHADVGGDRVAHRGMVAG
ncbi:MAG: taurine catabolism dioxygenase [Marmoricola sp.]|jgi:alpha-ketoglutarate-dependent taurine dioxygenase|nr:taurine catabolism dioxygenase [Marmoricola sp.]